MYQTWLLKWKACPMGGSEENQSDGQIESSKQEMVNMIKQISNRKLDQNIFKLTDKGKTQI